MSETNATPSEPTYDGESLLRAFFHPMYQAQYVTDEVKQEVLAVLARLDELRLHLASAHLDAGKWKDAWEKQRDIIGSIALQLNSAEFANIQMGIENPDFLARARHNKKILKTLTHMLNENPDLRFGQACILLKLFPSLSYPDETGKVFNEESATSAEGIVYAPPQTGPCPVGTGRLHPPRRRNA
jgi:hypothetical protein